MAGIRPHDEQPLPATRAGGAGAKRPDVRRDINGTVRRDDRARLEFEMNPAVQFPIRDVHREAVRVSQLHILLVLIAGNRVVIPGGDGKRNIGRLGERNAGIVGLVNADGERRVRDECLP